MPPTIIRWVPIHSLDCLRRLDDIEGLLARIPGRKMQKIEGGKRRTLFRVNLKIGRQMNLTVEIPVDLAGRLNAAGGDLSRRALEALGLEEYKSCASQRRNCVAFLD